MTRLNLFAIPYALKKAGSLKTVIAAGENKGIAAYLQEVVQILNNSSKQTNFCLVRQDKPRYIRDQLKIIKDNSKDKPAEFIRNH